MFSLNYWDSKQKKDRKWQIDSESTPKKKEKNIPN